LNAAEDFSSWRLFARLAFTALVIAVALFLPAGTLGWPAAWVFLGLFLGPVTALSLWLRRFDPALFAERMSGIAKPGQQTWDKVFLAVASVAFVLWLALMGLDARRFQWSTVPLWLQGLGALLLLSACYLFYLSFREHP
jgi:protein-S-isoprenylcysteine O-methyltransferase Ste14